MPHSPLARASACQPWIPPVVKCRCPPALRETPMRAWCEKADAPDGVPDDIPARTVTEMGKQRVNADLRLRLTVEDLDAAILQHGRVVERHLLERAVAAACRPVPQREVVAGVRQCQEHERGEQHPSDDA